MTDRQWVMPGNRLRQLRNQLFCDENLPTKSYTRPVLRRVSTILAISSFDLTTTRDMRLLHPSRRVTRFNASGWG